MKCEYMGREKEEVFNHNTGKYIKRYIQDSKPVAIIYANSRKENKEIDIMVRELCKLGYDYIGGFDAEEPYDISEWFTVEDKQDYKLLMKEYKRIKSYLK